jgi:serine/threonine-protein kinase RsbW
MLTPVTSAITPRTSTRTYPGAPENIRAARADLRGLLKDCPHADDIILCASELAANSATHSRSAEPGGTIVIHITIHQDEYVRIEVRDDGGPWTQPAIDTDRPHGLDIIRALASSSGVADTSAGRTSWAQLDWPAR